MANVTMECHNNFYYSVSYFQYSYDGTNRLGNVSVVSSTSTAVSTTNAGLYWDDPANTEISVIQALRMPLMGVAPGFTYKVSLKDSAENLSVGLKAFTSGQIASFNTVLISDNNVLVLDPTTF